MRTPIDVYRQADMEVAMHGENHLWVKACLGAEIVKEFYQDKLALEELTGGIIRGGAYAYGCYNEETLSVLKTLGLSYFRTTQATGGFDVPMDWLRVPMTCRHKDANLFSILERFLAERPNKPYAYRCRCDYGNTDYRRANVRNANFTYLKFIRYVFRRVDFKI